MECWSTRRASNSQPSAWKADTLPIELLVHKNGDLSLFAVRKHYLVAWVGGLYGNRRKRNPESNWAGVRTGGAAHDSIYDGSSISYRCSNTRLFTSLRRPIWRGCYCQLTIFCHTLCATHTEWWGRLGTIQRLLVYETSVLPTELHPHASH